jgi:hypothetical protein
MLLIKYLLILTTTWKNADCDKDGNPNGTDPNPKVATANADMLTAPFGVPSIVNVLTNDDFLPGLSTSITKTGGTAIRNHFFQ